MTCLACARDGRCQRQKAPDARERGPMPAARCSNSLPNSLPQGSRQVCAPEAASVIKRRRYELRWERRPAGQLDFQDCTVSMGSPRSPSGIPVSRLPARASAWVDSPHSFGGSSSCFYSQTSNAVSKSPWPACDRQPGAGYGQTKHVASRRGSGQSARGRRDLEGFWGASSSVGESRPYSTSRTPLLQAPRKPSVTHCRRGHSQPLAVSACAKPCCHR